MHRDNRCMYMTHVCFYVVVIVWGLWECVLCSDRCFRQCFSLGILKYFVCLCKECDGCCVFSLYCDTWSCR